MDGRLPNVSGYFAPVCRHGERIRDDDDADAPGECDPDVASNWLLFEQGPDRIDDGGGRLVFRKGAHGARHRIGGDECRTHEQQENDRIGEGTRPVRGFRR